MAFSCCAFIEGRKPTSRLSPWPSTGKNSSIGSYDFIPDQWYISLITYTAAGAFLLSKFLPSQGLRMLAEFSGKRSQVWSAHLSKCAADSVRSGHRIQIGLYFQPTNCVRTTVSGGDYVKGYTITAVPEMVGKKGDRGFCIDQNGGSPKYDPAGGTNCTQLVLQ
jgi:hypothetical protein